MSSLHLEHSNTTTMIPTREAAKLVGYTADYVAKLARDGVVEATRQGRSWFVNPESLKLFTLQAEAEKRERQKQLREFRKEERANARVKAQGEVLVAKVDSGVSVAVAQVVALFLCGVLLASISFVSYQEELDLEAFSFGAFSVSESLLSIFGWGKETPTQPAAIPTPTPTAETPGIVVLDGEASAAEVAAVRDSFSDEVVIEFEGEDTGIIQPVFKSGKEEGYRFLLVPVTEAANASTE